jgi:hypothetical protein
MSKSISIFITMGNAVLAVVERPEPEITYRDG